VRRCATYETLRCNSGYFVSDRFVNYNRTFTSDAAYFTSVARVCLLLRRGPGQGSLYTLDCTPAVADGRVAGGIMPLGGGSAIISWLN